METLTLTYILLVFTVTLVNGATPDCAADSLTCTDVQTCAWACTVAAGTAGDVDVSKCTSDTTCKKGSTTGTCAAACKDNSAGPDCSAAPCTAGKTCSWNCKVADGITGAVNVSKCTTASTCTKGTTTGKCVPTCKDTPGDNGKNKNSGNGVHGLSPLILISAVIIKLLISP